MKFNLQNIIKKVEGLDQLTVPFTNEEIDVVIKEMSADRAPGPMDSLVSSSKNAGILSRRTFMSIAISSMRGTQY